MNWQDKSTVLFPSQNVFLLITEQTAECSCGGFLCLGCSTRGHGTVVCSYRKLIKSLVISTLHKNHNAY